MEMDVRNLNFNRCLKTIHFIIEFRFFVTNSHVIMAHCKFNC